MDWVGLENLYDDPLYRRLPFLLDEESVTRSLDDAMSALVIAIHERDLTRVKQAIASIHDARAGYAGNAGADRHEEPQLLALYHFELRGMAYIRYDSLQRRDAWLAIEDGR